MGYKLVKFDDLLFYKILTLYTICIYLSSPTYVTAHCDYFSLKYVFLRQLAPFLQVVEVLYHA